MKELNWQIILSNIKEAREELEQLEKTSESEEPEQIELEISLRHAYHHLNFAWNTKNIPSENYANLTDSEFREWGRFPQGFDSLEVQGDEK
jgi:hypothetical protein